MDYKDRIKYIPYLLKCARTMVRLHRARATGSVLFREEFPDEVAAPDIYFTSAAISDQHVAMSGMNSQENAVYFFGGSGRVRLATGMFSGYYVDPISRYSCLWNPSNVAAFDALGLGDLANSSQLGSNVLLCGYSGGGALATMFATALAVAVRPRSISLVTFGCPRVSDRRWLYHSGQMRWIRVQAWDDPVEFVVPHRGESTLSANLNPALQNQAELYWNFGLPVYPHSSGIVQLGDWDVQREPSLGLLGNLIDWFTGAAERRGENWHMIEHYEYLLGLATTNPQYDGLPLFGTQETPSRPPALPADYEGIIDPLPSGFQNSATDSDRSYANFLNENAAGILPPLGTVLKRRPFRRLKCNTGWFVSYLGSPFIHCSNKRQAGQVANSLNRVLKLLDRYPDDDPATLIASLQSELASKVGG